MDAVKFIRDHERMCKAQESCEQCQAYGNCLKLSSFPRCKPNIRREVKLVEAWASEHPEKTRWDLLKEQYPSINDDMKYKICVRYLGYHYICCHPSLCGDCWDMPIEEEKQE